MVKSPGSAPSDPGLNDKTRVKAKTDSAAYGTMRSPEYWIRKLQLQPHPEGGWFAEYYRASGTIPQPSLPGYSGDRSYCTSIYFLLTNENFSSFHRLRSDELWYFHDGSPLIVHQIDANGCYRDYRVGLDAQASPQCLVPAGTWFASSVDTPGGHALVGCAVSPGFDFTDFEIGKRSLLIAEYPQHAEIISKLTRT